MRVDGWLKSILLTLSKRYKMQPYYYKESTITKTLNLNITSFQITIKIMNCDLRLMILMNGIIKFDDFHLML